MTESPIRVWHIITTLDVGGAEMMLYKLMSAVNRAEIDPTVISLTNVGSIGRRIAQLGIPVRSLNMTRSVPNPLAVLRLASWMRRDRPNVVQTWMYHADLLGGIAAALGGRPPIAWGIRQTDLEPGASKRTTILTARACARLSHRLPDSIICCSQVASKLHVELGYSARKMVVIPNGFDLSAYRPDPEARLAVRTELGVSDTTPLIGLVARFHPQKDHPGFARAAGLLHAGRPDASFLLCGAGIDAGNQALTDALRDAGVEDHCHLLGKRDDVPRLTAALDIGTSASWYGEGFPNVVGEAMACGVPCVVTDVGDSAHIVGDTGRVVPKKRPDCLAAAWAELIDAGPAGLKRLGIAARHRIETHFSLVMVERRYAELHQELATLRRGKL